MRRIITLLLVLSLLLLPGCGKPAQPKDEGPLTLNPDGTLGNLRWGMSYGETAYADNRIVFGSGGDLSGESCAVEFLGKKWRLTPAFGFYDRGHIVFGSNGTRRYLVGLELTPLEESGGWKELAGSLEAVFGPRNIRFEASGESWDDEGNYTCTDARDLPEWAWRWASSEVLGDRVSRETLVRSVPDLEGVPYRINTALYGSPLLCVYFMYYSEAHRRYNDICPEEEPEGLPAVFISACNTVWAELLQEG